jgi:hypothetical protein
MRISLTFHLLASFACVALAEKSVAVSQKQLLSRTDVAQGDGIFDSSDAAFCTG